jgi:hypothetical protein
LAGFYVPEFDFACADPNTEVRAVIRKVDGGDVGAFWSFSDTAGGARLCTPDIRALSKSDGHHILTAPADQIKIEVIHHARGIQDPLRLSGYLPALICDGASRAREGTGTGIERPSELALEREGGV